MIRLIALDLDGTLALENHQISPATRDALHDLHHDKGVEVVIATGRRYRTTRYVIDNLGFDVFAICNGGALVKAPDQTTIHAENFSVAPFLQLARQNNLALFAQRDAHHLGGADFIMDSVPNWNRMTKLHIKTNKKFCEVGDLAECGDEFMVAGCFGEQADLNQLAAQIAEAHGDVYNTIVVPHLQTEAFYCEISLAHVDKWQGLQKILPQLKVEADNVCAVGDQLNDMAMVTAAGHGVAMENGHEDLQASAKFVCGHNQNDGILDVVSYIHEHNRQFTE